MQHQGVPNSQRDRLHPLSAIPALRRTLRLFENRQSSRPAQQSTLVPNALKKSILPHQPSTPPLCRYVLPWLLLLSGVLATLHLILTQSTKWRTSSSSCSLRQATPARIKPDVLFVTLTSSTSALSALKRLTHLNVRGQSCVIRLYTTTTPDYEYCSSKFHAMCLGKGNGCRVEARLSHNARMWGDLALLDVPKETTVIFLREGSSFSERALDWVTLAHAAIASHYRAGGRRDIVGAAIGCRGERSLSSWWAHAVGPLNSTCAFSPVRVGREDPWAFFASWFAARRREWNAWPHIWEEERAVPVFWKGKSKHKRDHQLARFGKRVGTDYSYCQNPPLLWERWYTRWAANYTMRVLTAETNLGIGLNDMHDAGIGSVPMPVFNANASEIAVSTSVGDLVSVGGVWYEPVDDGFGKGYFHALQTIVATAPKMVSLTIVNSQFLELTKSWLCNVNTTGLAPPNIYWIALDEESKTALRTLGTGQIVDIADALIGENMDPVHILYGRPSYWKLMLMRTRLIRDLLDRGIDVFLFETDQIWLQNPFHFITKELDAGADMVGTLDSQHNIAGNTILLKSVLATRRMWSEVYHRFKVSYDLVGVESKAIDENTFVQHDQYQLSDLLLFNTEFTQDYPVALGLLNAQLFVGGSWYTGSYTTAESKKPVIINNNFISGSARKKARAITFGHWFLHEDGQTCNLVSVRKALRYEFTQVPGRELAEYTRTLPEKV